MLNNKVFNFAALMVLLIPIITISAQTKRNKRAKTATQTETKQTAATEIKPEATPTPVNAVKKNSRPVSEKTSDAATEKQSDKPPAFVYEFSQPAFVISHIVIEHDESGKGKITFKKKDFDEEYDDPVQLSAVTLEKLKTYFDALNFLESTENYQYEKDYAHLGNVKITMRSKDGKERTAAYNWTTNENAKALMNEYRKLANQYLWMFDMTVARQNQPLETPRIMKSMDGYIRRNEISDPSQMIPFLKDLSNDERVPLITRNDAANLVKQIEKNKK